MNRSQFSSGAVAAVAWGAATSAGATPLFRVQSNRIRPGAQMSLAELLGDVPPPASGDLVQYELSFGATYDKQIGFGHETDGADRYLFVETQVGNGNTPAIRTRSKSLSQERDVRRRLHPVPGAPVCDAFGQHARAVG